MSAGEHLARICNQIGSQCADERGFVSVRSLLERFGTSLIRRPLLVEAMLAKVAAVGAGDRPWTILVDSERYPISDEDLADETVSHPLPARFRFTVAHELAHSVSFRETEFGFHGFYAKSVGASRQAIVSAVESETDRVSSILLLPDSTLRKQLTLRDRALEAKDVATLCATFGISRYALIHRLKLLLDPRDQTDLRQARALQNLAVGLGEWSESGARLLKWPLFSNFQNRIEPALVHKLANHDVRVAEEFGVATPIMTRGEIGTFDFQSIAGLRGSTPDETMQVRWTAEATSHRPGAKFLFALGKLS